MDQVKFQSVSAQKANPAPAFVVIGDKQKLPALDFSGLLPASLSSNAARLAKPVSEGRADSVSHFSETDDSELTLCHLGDERTRNCGLIRSDLLTDIVGKAVPKDKDTQVIIVCKDAQQVFPAAAAVARAFPRYNKKTKSAETTPSSPASRTIYVDFVLVDEKKDAQKIDYAALQRCADGVRLCAYYVDMPPSELYTDNYVEEAKAIAAKLKSVTVTVIQGKELEKRGFGGLWGVGKAATHLPALVVLSHLPSGAKHTSCWVGKGIMYDTGGLSIKGSTNMPTMKCDMGGSAAILAAFEAAVTAGYDQNLHALLCLAENSVSAESTRPDDILYMYSGKTVEVNNTDAEGRLVLADGVSYATKHLKPDLVLDMATLTGAQGIATGQKHAAILCNDAEVEQLGYEAGQKSGDWVFPLLYAPEILKKEFSSEVADMRNSVKSRSNAQSSCAGHFIEDHLDSQWKGKWIHVDIAGPAFKDGRATGFGVAFLLQFLNEVRSKLQI